MDMSHVIRTQINYEIIQNTKVGLHKIVYAILGLHKKFYAILGLHKQFYAILLYKYVLKLEIKLKFCINMNSLEMNRILYIA